MAAARYKMYLGAIIADGAGNPRAHVASITSEAVREGRVAACTSMAQEGGHHEQAERGTVGPVDGSGGQQ
jgi:hypothetical protein